ncbi:MAG: tRNA (adenosine(37)-N6)-threonylcarbamoyltransferase complex transferase subunit TsaD [Isosphaeraceae bacterium]
MLLLSIETTCDETGAAVLEGEPGGPTPLVRSSVVASQFDLHQRFGGVVPEIASRAHVRQILPVIDEALKQARASLPEIGAIAVATRPGLVGSLVIGLTAAKALALALDLPMVAFDHLEGHLYAAQLAEPDRPIYPCVGLVISGGHSHIYRCDGPINANLLGGTIDDAAGEAFDKVAGLLGLPHPGGPNLEKLARGGNPRAYRLPRSFLREDRLEFSFSGLKTAVLYALKGQDGIGPENEAARADLAASFQEAVVDVIAAKACQALEKTGLGRLVVGGGVAANGRLRAALEELGEERGCEVRIPPPSWCTDNAALGGVAFAKLAAGQVADLGIDVTPGLVRPGRG